MFNEKENTGTNEQDNKTLTPLLGIPKLSSPKSAVKSSNDDSLNFISCALGLLLKASLKRAIQRFAGQKNFSQSEFSLLAVISQQAISDSVSKRVFVKKLSLICMKMNMWMNDFAPGLVLTLSGVKSNHTAKINRSSVQQKCNPTFLNLSQTRTKSRFLSLS